MTKPTTNIYARRAATAMEALARATHAKPGTMPISDLYTITADLLDITRHLAQVTSQLDRHITTRAEQVQLRVDANGEARYGTPAQAIDVAGSQLTNANSSARMTTHWLGHALGALATLAETGPRQ